MHYSTQEVILDHDDSKSARKYNNNIIVNK